MTKRKNHDDYVAELEIKNPNVEVIGEYAGNHVKIDHRCKIHNIIWKAAPANVLKGQGCSECGRDKLRKAQQYSEEEYVNMLKNAVPHVKLVGKYISMRTPTLHYCIKHDLYWEPRPTNLIRGCGCKYCANDLLREERIKSHEQYVEDLHNINPNVIVLDTYKGANVAILHRCLIDGNEWFATPGRLLYGCGCPECNESQGEKQIKKWLYQHNIEYDFQHTFVDCKDKRVLPFDFYLPELNVCIEYDGKQHFQSVDFFGGENGLQIRQLHDSIKTKYCQDNNIQLLRIPYFKNIEEELNNFIHLI